MIDPFEGQREFERQKSLAAQNYTPEFIASLAEKFGIRDPEKIASLREFLQFAAWLYRDLKNDEKSKLPPRAIRDKFKNILSVAETLRSELSSLNEAADEIYWGPQRNLSSLLFYLTADVSPFGHKIVRRQIDPDTRSITYLREDQIHESLEIIGNLARHALTRIKLSKGGRYSDEALRMWVVNMHSFWENILGRPFTYDSYKGKGVTPAFEFCQNALKPLNPRVTASELATAMRKAIKLNAPKRLPRKLRRKNLKHIS